MRAEPTFRRLQSQARAWVLIGPCKRYTLCTSTFGGTGCCTNTSTTATLINSAAAQSAGHARALATHNSKTMHLCPHRLGSRPQVQFCHNQHQQYSSSRVPSHKSRRQTLARVRAAPEEDSTAEPQLFGDWRAFRAKLILGEDISTARWSAVQMQMHSVC